MKSIRNFMMTLALAAFLAPALSAQGWQVSPARQEITIGPGQSRTFAIRVERESVGGIGEVRFTATPRDWDLSRSGEVQEAAAATTPNSANGWMTFTPAVFNLQADGYALVRVTLSVPAETAPGVYRAALFFEEHSIVPPASQDTRRMVLRYRLSTLMYIIVPKIEKKLDVQDVLVSGSGAEGLTLTAVLNNTGTVHLRPKHWVEIADASGNVFAKLEPRPTMPVLPSHQLEVSVQVPKDLLRPSPSYTVRYFVDADRELPLKASSVNVISQP